MPIATNHITAAEIDRSQAVNLADIAIEHGMVLKRSGGEFVGPCPRCGGTDRFAINPKKRSSIPGASAGKAVAQFRSSNGTMVSGFAMRSIY